MKILLSNKFYYHRGGDCIYTLNLEKLLKQHGHEVAIFSMNYPENLDNPYQKYFPSEVTFSLSNKKGLIESSLRPLGTNEVKQKFTQLLNDYSPDIVHLNNIHTQLSPVLAEIAHKKNIKVIWTLHDYKLLCPRYDCFRNDIEICELCFVNKIHVLKNRCMKNSLLASIIAFGEALKWSRIKLEKYTTSFICPSLFLKEKMIQGGFDPSKLTVLNNFIDTSSTQRENYTKENYYCYIGRLSHEKGINTLIEAAQQLPYKIKIIGTGPLLKELQNHANYSNIEFVGYKKWPEIKEIVGNALFSVIPSEWYENNPLSVIEALCLGTPVLGATIGGIPELIEENVNGCLFKSGDVEDLKEKIEKMINMRFDYNSIAQEAQLRFSAEKYYTELMKIYNTKE